MRYIILVFLLTAALFPQEKPPAWAKGIVWYQIFPERFANGDQTNDPEAAKVFFGSRSKADNWKLTPWTSNWFGQADWEKAMGSFGHSVQFRRYGGDLRGLINKLDYIKNLGVGAIYLNPVFEAVSLHKYDASTYHHIDVNFGPDPEGDRKLIATETPENPATWQMTSADKLFVKFLDEAHKRNLKVIIDGVFNHSGPAFWAFQDIIKNQSSSKYKDWYQIVSFRDSTNPTSKFDYKGWWGFKGLPQFNRTTENLHPAVKDYIIAATKRWLDPNGDGSPSDGIDGWRLDVANEVPLGFWREWRKAVKSVNPNAIIIGEFWSLSPEYVGKDCPFDGLMNYPFAYAAEDFFIAQKKQITADTLIARLKKIDATYPEENLYVLQNLMDSHDTERLLSMIANPDRQFDRDANTENPNYNPGKPKTDVYNTLRLIVAFQMTYRGAPMVYYGDEVGMWGADDPHDRKPMVWDELQYENETITAESGFKTGLGSYKITVDKDLLKFYRRMIAIRNNFETLKTGSLEFLPIGENKHVFGFKRTLGDETVLVVFNAGEQSEVMDVPVNSQTVQDLLVGDLVKLEGKNLHFVVWGKSFAIFRI